jgi:L-threonylcarbamoyladenylate synthase
LSQIGRADAISALRRGDVILMDTDTLPGLHALASVPGAADRITGLKGRRQDRAYLLLVESADEAFGLGSPVTAEQARQLREIWPAALTALLIPAPTTSGEWTHDGRSIGIRVPAAPALRAVLAELGGPLLSSSANRVGDLPAPDLAAASRCFPDLQVLELGAEPVGMNSTIVDYTVNPANLVRAGIIAFDPESGPKGAA